MKSYYDYMQDYANVLRQGLMEGKTFILNPQIYVGIHFLADNGITDPWKPDTVAKLRKIIAKCDGIDGIKFLTAINAVYDMLDSESELI